MNNSIPRCFISYSWSSPEHETWVLNLATDLRSSGVDVILDKWDLREGQDSIAFMEKMVTDPEIKKVLLVCDRVYAEKADKRAGGVGTEAQIITPRIYQSTAQTKFVAVIREVNPEGRPYVPTYYEGRIHIDLSNEEVYTQNFERLVRWIFDKPIHIKPDIGKPPTYVTESSNTVILGNGAARHRAIDAMRTGKSYSSGALEEYLESCITDFEKFKISREADTAFDDAIIGSVESFTNARNDLIEVFTLIARYADTEDTQSICHRFFEKLIPFMEASESAASYSTWDFDNYKFIIHELFLYLIAILMRREKFGFVRSLMDQPYYVRGRQRAAQSYVKIRQHMDSLESRNRRLGLRRLSLRADLLKERCKGIPIEFSDLMQADFVLFIRSSVEALGGGDRQWWPETLLYASSRSHPLEVFARAQSREYFDRFKGVLGVESKDDLGLLFEGFSSGKIRNPQWEFESLPTAELMGFEQLGSRR